VIGQRYPLAEAAQAHRDLEAGRTTGATHPRALIARTDEGKTAMSDDPLRRTGRRASARTWKATRFNGCVGSVLVSETDKVRVWHLHLPAGKRCAFHRHVLDYFWTCHSHGKARGYFEDGAIRDVTHFPGDTRH
jgi:hypothetical protein